MDFARKDLLGIEDLSAEEIVAILDTAQAMKEILTRDKKKVPTLQGKTVVTLFFESSTRTRLSFELAAKRLSADTLSVAAQTSSVTKRETLLDTVRNLEAMQADYIVLRHPLSGAAAHLAQHSEASIVNAGDGSHEHPSQALLDAFTIRERFGKLSGLKVLIVGDIAHSRVARSNLFLLTKLGAKVMFAGPGTLLPDAFSKMGAELHERLDDAIPQADVIMMLRVQFERMKGPYFPSEREYALRFCLSPKRLAQAPKHAIVMHPGPVNRGLEVSPEVADGSSSVILDQVSNGIATRMAILYLLSNGKAQKGQA
ncbi:MAG: aspartate carbamoyltransferase catalytic subunit [Bdellovibrionota bacterium]